MSKLPMFGLFLSVGNLSWVFSRVFSWFFSLVFVYWIRPPGLWRHERKRDEYARWGALLSAVHNCPLPLSMLLRLQSEIIHLLEYYPASLDNNTRSLVLDAGQILAFDSWPSLHPMSFQMMDIVCTKGQLFISKDLTGICYITYSIGGSRICSPSS